MAYPNELVGEYWSTQIAEDLGIDNIGTPVIELTNDDADVNGYRFATLERNGTCYIRFDRSTF